MKNLIQKLSFFCLSILFSASVLGQDTMFKGDHQIMLKGDSQEEEIKLEVQKNAAMFDLKIKSGVSSGSLKIEIYNPDGEKVGNFSVGSQLKNSAESKKTEMVFGSINKSIKEPKAGLWVIKIIPQAAVGDVKMMYYMAYAD